jgi:hypothetical protein
VLTSPSHRFLTVTAVPINGDNYWAGFPQGTTKVVCSGYPLDKLSIETPSQKTAPRYLAGTVP